MDLTYLNTRPTADPGGGFFLGYQNFGQSYNNGDILSI